MDDREPLTFTSSPPPSLVGAWGVVAAGGAAYVARKAGVCVDDVFITATFARNLALGEGMVFNAGERILGVTTPLWCWLQAAMMVVRPAAREGVVGLGVLAFLTHVFAGIMIALLAWRLGAGWWSVLAAGGWALIPAHVTLFGMEYGLATGLAAGAVVLFTRGKMWTTGVVCSLLALTRPEAAVLSMLLFGLLLAHGRWRHAVALAVPSAVVGLATLLIFQLYYGSPLPNTLEAKRMQFDNREEFIWLISVGQGAWRFLIVEVLRGDVLPALLGVFGLGVLLMGAWRERNGSTGIIDKAAVFFPGWVCLHIIALTALGVAYYPWYLWPLWMVFPVAIAVGMAHVARAIPRGDIRGPALVAVVVLLLVGWQRPWAGDPAGPQRDRRDGYFQLAGKINTLADGMPASVLATEVGALGFGLDRNIQVLDQVLLVSENPVAGRSQGGAPDRFPTDRDFVSVHRPEFILESHPAGADLTPQQAAFQDQRRDPEFELVYELDDGAAVRYVVIERIESRYGMQLLLMRTD